MNEKEAIKAYVTGADHLQYTQLADGMVQVSCVAANEGILSFSGHRHCG
jgi:hypothetical protein